MHSHAAGRLRHLPASGPGWEESRGWFVLARGFTVGQKHPQLTQRIPFTCRKSLSTLRFSSATISPWQRTQRILHLSIQCFFLMLESHFFGERFRKTLQQHITTWDPKHRTPEISHEHT